MANELDRPAWPVIIQSLIKITIFKWWHFIVLSSDWIWKLEHLPNLVNSFQWSVIYVFDQTCTVWFPYLSSACSLASGAEWCLHQTQKDVEHYSEEEFSLPWDFGLLWTSPLWCPQERLNLPSLRTEKNSGVPRKSRATGPGESWRDCVTDRFANDAIYNTLIQGNPRNKNDLALFDYPEKKRPRDSCPRLVCARDL